MSVWNLLGEWLQLLHRVPKGIFLFESGAAPRSMPEWFLCRPPEHDGVCHVRARLLVMVVPSSLWEEELTTVPRSLTRLLPASPRSLVAADYNAAHECPGAPPVVPARTLRCHRNRARRATTA